LHATGDLKGGLYNGKHRFKGYGARYGGFFGTIKDIARVAQANANTLG
jgi:hypothetical protein